LKKYLIAGKFIVSIIEFTKEIIDVIFEFLPTIEKRLNERLI
jgi:hypothetical protein